MIERGFAGMDAGGLLSDFRPCSAYPPDLPRLCVVYAKSDRAWDDDGKGSTYLAGEVRPSVNALLTPLRELSGGGAACDGADSMRGERLLTSCSPELTIAVDESTSASEGDD
jgi:hypothetical protein